jgi:hypothetical protein
MKTKNRNQHHIFLPPSKHCINKPFNVISTSKLTHSMPTQTAQTRILLYVNASFWPSGKPIHWIWKSYVWWFQHTLLSYINGEGLCNHQIVCTDLEVYTKPSGRFSRSLVCHASGWYPDFVISNFPQHVISRLRERIPVMMLKQYSCQVLGNIMLYGIATFVRVTLWRMWYNYGGTKIFFGFPFDADIRTRFSQTITATQRTVLKHTQPLRTSECGAEVITSYSICDERMSIGHWWNNNDWGKLKYSEIKPAPLPFRPPQIPHGFVQDWA